MLKLFFLIIGTSFIYSQPSGVTQITNFDMDCRNPSLLFTGSQSGTTYLVFEGYTDSAVNIYSMQYSPSSNTFYNLKNLTNNSSKNIKPILQVAELATDLLFFQTNKRGNWDIELALPYDTASSPFLSTQDDETDFNFVSHSLTPQKFSAIYHKNDDIHLILDYNGSLVDEKIFDSDTTIKYIQATGSVMLIDKPFGFIAAIGVSPGEQPKVYYRYRNENDNSWGPVKVAYDSGSCQRIFAFQDRLAIESVINGKINIYMFENVFQFGNNLLAKPVNAQTDFESFNYKGVDLNSHVPCPIEPHLLSAFQLRRNDSIFIYTKGNLNQHTLLDTIIYTSVKNGSLEIKPMYIGLFNEFISYTIWEDSANGKINLFGMKREDFITDIEDHPVAVNSFQLYQNYPNPFNPSTTISWQSPISSRQTLKIFDVLGNEVVTLVDEYRPEGKYKVQYDAATLASGIYFYRLQAGKFVSTKKFILMK